jgi:E3 ubiquitin-protein ligase RNF144
MVADDDDHKGEPERQSECQVCRRLFCAQCCVPWHAGSDCAAYKHLGKVDMAREDMMVLEMAKGKNWKRCPRCQFFVEKTDGCLHITCRYSILYF